MQHGESAAIFLYKNTLAVLALRTRSFDLKYISGDIPLVSDTEQFFFHCYSILIFPSLPKQIVELKKRLDEDAGMMESYEEGKKKIQRDNENLQGQCESLQAENDKLQKSKKKLQAEVEDLGMELDNQRSNLLSMEKKQRKFDQNLAEEKAISERYVLTTFAHEQKCDQTELQVPRR